MGGGRGEREENASCYSHTFNDGRRGFAKCSPHLLFLGDSWFKLGSLPPSHIRGKEKKPLAVVCEKCVSRIFRASRTKLWQETTHSIFGKHLWTSSSPFPSVVSVSSRGYSFAVSVKDSCQKSGRGKKGKERKKYYVCSRKREGVAFSFFSFYYSTVFSHRIARLSIRQDVVHFDALAFLPR